MDLVAVLIREILRHFLEQPVFLFTARFREIGKRSIIDKKSENDKITTKQYKMNLS